MILAVALLAAILLQQRGTGLGGAFGGEVTAYRSRRGIERTLFRMTIVLAVLFVAFSLLNLLPQAFTSTPGRGSRGGVLSPALPRTGRTSGCGRAEVAELVDALGSGPSGRKVVWVQVPPSVPSNRFRAQVAELVYAYV